MKPSADSRPSPGRSWLRRRHGPLTEDLVLHPGKFGLGQVPARLTPDAVTTTVCGYCSTGCGLNAHLRGNEAINLTAATDYPVNLGMACPKGWEALTPLKSTDRATTPWLRNDRTGKLEPCDWERALILFCERFKDVQRRHGPESVAWLGTGQITTEELAYLGSLAKFGMGILHGDGNTRQCMATAVTAYKESFGFDAPPYSYADFEESDVIVLVGSNLCIAHPILWQRILRNRRRPEIIVVDPRKTETAMAATQHYAIRPKSDLILFYGLARRLIANGWVDRDYVARHTDGFAAFSEFVARFTEDAVVAATGLSAESLTRLAETIHRGERVSFWWTMGVNQGHEATRTAQAIINLALMTGNLGRPGTGANSITGQCNAMGSRLYSNTTNLLGGHEFKNPEHRRKIAGVLGIPEGRIPARDSWAYDQIIDGIGSGSIKGLWIVATNTAHSWIQQKRFQDATKNLEFLVVQDMYQNTETAQGADLILPAAGWGEKEGTFINSERRFGLLKKIARAPGQALSDFNIFRLIAQYWGCADLFGRWSSPEAVFQILKECSRGQPCDITGIRDYADIDAEGGIQWPCTEQGEKVPSSKFQVPRGKRRGTGDELRDGAASPVTRHPSLPKERRLFEDGRFYHANGKARFVFEEPRALPEAPDAEFPFLLLTGRGTSAQWHTGTRTGKSDVLKKLSPAEACVEINPADAQRRGIRPGDKVEVRSRRGAMTASAIVTPTIQRGQVFLPMHYAAVNELTLAVVDPYSRQPAYKACAVSVELMEADTRRGRF
jgi:anaerobic selenocysteine-containing dehydrogenase